MAEPSDFDLLKLRHDQNMKEIEFKFDCEMKLQKKKHDDEMESQRIKEAGIRKSLDRKASMRFDDYPPK